MRFFLNEASNRVSKMFLFFLDLCSFFLSGGTNDKRSGPKGRGRRGGVIKQ